MIVNNTLVETTQNKKGFSIYLQRLTLTEVHSHRTLPNLEIFYSSNSAVAHTKLTT